jgi:hypothetical protein
MKWAHIVVGVLVFASSAFAQTGQSTITGTVTDPDGDVVQGAPVQLRNTATGAVITAESVRTGVYTASVPPGTYSITVQDIGFRFDDYEHKGDITIRPNQSVQVDITLAWLNFGAPGDDVYLTLHNKYAGKVTGPTCGYKARTKIPQTRSRSERPGRWPFERNGGYATRVLTASRQTPFRSRPGCTGSCRLRRFWCS